MSEQVPRIIVVIGAARSGTKVVRDSLAAAAGGGVVPYDIGFVWRYGNESTSHDVLRPEAVKPKTRRLVRSYIAKYAENGLVVEKTVGNTLRVPYVDELLPDASYVYVERDGVDVAASTRREWLAPNDYRYLARKLRHFPLRLLPTYGVKFARSQTVDRDKNSGHVGTWGPRYPDIDRELDREGLLRVCARQWAWSVRTARRDLATMEEVVHLPYDDLLADPDAALSRVLKELSLPDDPQRVSAGAAMIDAGASHPTRGSLAPEERDVLTQELGPLLQELGYEAP